MNDLELLEKHLAEDLAQRMAGGVDCASCVDGHTEHGFMDCPDCKGTGRSPAIAAAEEALEAVRRVRAGVAAARRLSHEPDTAYGLRLALDLIDTTKPDGTGSEG